jgi:hypothetical protein
MRLSHEIFSIFHCSSVSDGSQVSMKNVKIVEIKMIHEVSCCARENV